jgi:hypothetical protein
MILGANSHQGFGTGRNAEHPEDCRVVNLHGVLREAQDLGNLTV